MANTAELAVSKKKGGGDDSGRIDVRSQSYQKTPESFPAMKREGGSQPEPDTLPPLPKAVKGEVDTGLDLPPAKPDGSSDEPRPGANNFMKRFFGRSRNPDGSRREGRTEEQGAKGTEDDPIYVGNDVDQAVDLLVQGKHIRMSESPTVAMVVQKLGPALEQAEKDIKAKYNIPKGKTALDFPEGSRSARRWSRSA